MKKLTFTASQFTSTFNPPDRYVVRLETIGKALVARYFQVGGKNYVGEHVVQDQMVEINPSEIALMRQDVNQTNFLAPSAVTTNEAVADDVLSEIGRQVFRPTIGADTVCGFGERQDFALFVLPFTPNARVGEPYNHFTESESVKGQIRRNSRLRNGQPIFLLYSDVAGAPLDQWTLIYVNSPSFILEDATAGVWEQLPGNSLDTYSLLPQFTLDAPASVIENGSATVTVTLRRGGVVVPYNGEITVDAIAGYAPKRRVAVVNGTGSFKVMPLGLSAGDQVRVKIGTRNITGLADASISVA